MDSGLLQPHLLAASPGHSVLDTALVPTALSVDALARYACASAAMDLDVRIITARHQIARQWDVWANVALMASALVSTAPRMAAPAVTVVMTAKPMALTAEAVAVIITAMDSIASA